MRISGKAIPGKIISNYFITYFTKELCAVVAVTFTVVVTTHNASK